MKSKYYRLIKILSCSLAIAAVLLCSVYVPAQAAAPGTILNPADYISSTGYVGNYRVVDFDFGRTPYLEWLSSNHVSGYGEIQFTPPSDSALKGSLKIYPLGSSKMLGPPLDSNNVVIDITDFKSNAALSIVSEVRFEVDYALAGTDVQSEEPFSVSCVWSFLGYRSTGTFVGTVNSLSKTYQYTLQDTPDPFVAEFPFSLTLGLDFPSDVTYVIPYLSVNINTLYDDPDIVINKVACSCNDFNLSARTDMLLQESLTLDAIEGQLGDLNDKADTIISGSDEMQDQVDDVLSDSQDLDERLDQAIEELEDLEDISDQFVSDKYKDFSAVADDLRVWLATRPWNDFISLVQPIMEFPAMVTILSMLVAFINISILFFGR